MKTKREFVTDGSQTLMLFNTDISENIIYQAIPKGIFEFNPCTYIPYNILEKADGTFVCKGPALLSPSKDKFQPKILRKGCLVKVVNPDNEFFGKKLSVYDIDGQMITLLTHNGKMNVSALSLKVL